MVDEEILITSSPINSLGMGDKYQYIETFTVKMYILRVKTVVKCDMVGNTPLFVEGDPYPFFPGGGGRCNVTPLQEG